MSDDKKHTCIDCEFVDTCLIGIVDDEHECSANKRLREVKIHADKMHNSILDFFKIIYVGEGKVVCPPAFIPVIRIMQTLAHNYKFGEWQKREKQTLIKECKKIRDEEDLEEFKEFVNNSHEENNNEFTGDLNLTDEDRKPVDN